MCKLGDALVLLLRRDESDLSAPEKAAIQAAFPGRTVRFHRTDPVDYLEHARDCAALSPAAVLLPLDRPIPSAAMEAGFQHIVVRGDSVMRLEPLVPTFSPFVPKL